MTTKNIVLIISCLISIGLFIWEYIGNYGLCDLIATDGHLGSCPFLLSSLEIVFLPIIPLFLFSLITYFMREEIFRFWVRFAIPYVAVSMLVIYLTPEYSAGGFGPSISLGKGDVALVSCLLFVIISILIIGWKFIRK